MRPEWFIQGSGLKPAVDGIPVLLVVFGDRRPLSTLESGDCSDGRIDSTSESVNDALTKLHQPIQECGGTGRGAGSRIRMPSGVMPGGFFVIRSIGLLSAIEPIQRANEVPIVEHVDQPIDCINGTSRARPDVVSQKISRRGHRTY